MAQKHEGVYVCAEIAGGRTRGRTPMLRRVPEATRELDGGCLQACGDSL